MRIVLVLIVLPALLAVGCTPAPPVGASPYATQVAPIAYDNPTYIGAGDPTAVWETLADVVDDYFPDFAHEQPLRQVGQVVTEGHLETFPRGSPTMFEPWRRDATDGYQDVENTLQSMRRYAVVRVIPDASGYLVDLAVYKELEDVPRPERATAGAATLRYDTSLQRVDNPVGEQPIHCGWIPRGRDTLLEQRMLADLMSRLGRTAGAAPTGLPPNREPALEPIPRPRPLPVESLPPVDERPLVPVR